MGKPLFLALEEQLESEKLHALQIQANKDGESEVLFDNLKQQLVAKDLKEKTGEATGDEPSVDTVTDEVETDQPVESEEDKLTDGEEPEVTVESLKALTFSVENFYEQDTQYGSTPASLAKRFLEGVKSIGYFGVTHGPDLLKKAYKGVIRAFDAIASGLIVSINFVNSYLERRSRSLDKLSSSIDALQQAVSSIEDMSSLQDEQFTTAEVINGLKISNSVDFVSNIKVLETCVVKVVNGIDAKIRNDTIGTSHLIAQSGAFRTQPDVLMAVGPFSTSLKKETVDGYKHNEDLTISYKYSESLPSDAVLMAFLPKEDLNGIEQISHAYEDSKIFLGLDMSTFKSIEKVDYMTKPQLQEFLKELRVLCDVCIKQRKVYTDLLESKKRLRFTFKNYFTKLASGDRKVTVKESLVQYVYLKSTFIDKVYLVGLTHVHDYAAKTIRYGIRFTQEHVKKLT